MISRTLLYLIALALLWAWSGNNSAKATLLVYEGFNYGPTGTDQVTSGPNYNLLHNQPDGVGGDQDAFGLGGVWVDSVGPGVVSDTFLVDGSLSFDDLPTSGNSVRTDTNQNNDTFSRAITSTLDGGTELWFTFLANKLQNNFNAAEGGVVISNQTLTNSRVLENDGTNGLQGFGIAPTTSGNNWTAYGWNGTGQVVGGSTFGVPTNGSETNLLGGQVIFNAGSGGNDVFNLYRYTSATRGAGTRVLVTSIEVDVDESLLDTLNMTRQVNTHYDEIRIASTEEFALGAIPEPSTALGLILMLSGVFLRRCRRKLT